MEVNGAKKANGSKNCRPAGVTGLKDKPYKTDVRKKGNMPAGARLLAGGDRATERVRLPVRVTISPTAASKGDSLESTNYAFTTTTGELLEAGHFYGLLFAQRCYLLSPQPFQYRSRVVDARDW